MATLAPQTNQPLEKALNPWERIAWSPQHEQIIYRDWGTFFSYQQQLDSAAHYYDKSLALRKDDANCLYFRSQCKRNIAQTSEALKDALLAANLEPYKPRNSMAVTDALYELNQFESAKIELHDSTRKYFGSIVNEFLNRLVVVDGNLNDSLGDSLALFFMKNFDIVAEVAEAIKRDKIVDTRPEWKKRRDEGKCDVMSIEEETERLLSPCELACRERAYRIFNQIYFERGWIDAIFMRNLRNNKSWLPPQFLESTPLLSNLIATKYQVVRKFLKMLHVRSPLYNETLRKFPNRKLRELHKESYLNYVQYQTRRNMLSALRQVRRLRKAGKPGELAKFVESIMGDYVVLKTLRVMPWKFEFMNEVFNTLALAFADRYTVPAGIIQKKNDDQLLHLLGVPVEMKDRPVHFEFGNKATSLGANDYDYKYEKYKKHVARLEKRMIFAKYAFERCYLWHEIARAHLKQSRYDECCVTAKRAIDESKNCNNRLWAFLSEMLIVKSHASLRKIERCKEALDEAYNTAHELGSEQLCFFVDTARQINDDYIALKKKARSMEGIRSRRKSSFNLDDGDDAISTKSHASMSDGTDNEKSVQNVDAVL